MTPEHPQYEKHRDYLLEFMKKQEREEQIKQEAAAKGKMRKEKEYQQQYGKTWTGKKYTQNTNTYSPKKYKSW